MLTSMRIRLLPTPEQEQKFWQCAGIARWTYNYYLNEQDQAYQDYQNRGCVGKKRKTFNEIRKQTTELKHTTHPWLQEVGVNVVKQALRDANTAFWNWLSKKRGKPHFKTKHNSIPSFYLNYEKFSRKDGGFYGERIGFVKTTRTLPRLPNHMHYSDPRITYDGTNWYLSVSFPFLEKDTAPLNGETIGIDLGIKQLAVCSNQKVYPNINKSTRVKKLKQRLKRAHRCLGRRMHANIEKYTTKNGKRRPVWKRDLQDCKNFQKQVQTVRSLERQLANIRHNYTHQITTEIAKSKPSTVVMEHLNVRGMMKNRHMSAAIAEQNWYEFRRQMQYKCQQRHIDFVLVPMNYPSSKKCSCCGNVKKSLKLKERVYKCEVCGAVLDRDLNASLNLANYNLQKST